MGLSGECGLWGRLAFTASFDKYDYTGDREFLESAYPIVKGSAEFFLDFLTEEPEHNWLVVAPSISPKMHLLKITLNRLPLAQRWIINWFLMCLRVPLKLPRF